MKILALEFSSPQRSVAVVSAKPDGDAPGPFARCGDAAGPDLRHGGALRVQAGPAGLPGEVLAGRQITELIETGRGATQALPMIDEALRDAKLEREQIELLAIGIGPGSYTGIRAAIALAQGWQLACGVKLLGISSVECLARQACAEGLTGRVNVVIDAQRGEFYLAQFELGAGECREVKPLRLATRTEVQEAERADEVLIGPEVTRWFAGGRMVFPRAAMLGELALNRTDYVAGEKLEPVYLREIHFVKAPPPRVLP